MCNIWGMKFQVLNLSPTSGCTLSSFPCSTTTLESPACLESLNWQWHCSESSWTGIVTTTVCKCYIAYRISLSLVECIDILCMYHHHNVQWCIMLKKIATSHLHCAMLGTTAIANSYWDSIDTCTKHKEIMEFFLSRCMMASAMIALSLSSSMV